MGAPTSKAQAARTKKQTARARWRGRFAVEDGRLVLEARVADPTAGRAPEGAFGARALELRLPLRGALQLALLAAQDAAAPGAPDLSFRLSADPGDLVFEGRRRGPALAGTVRFEARSEFADALDRLGAPAPEAEQLLGLAVAGATLDELEAFAAGGLRDLCAASLLSLAVAGIRAETLVALRAAELPPLDSADLIRLQAASVDPDFVSGLAELGLGGLGVEQLIRLREDGVTPAFVRGFQELGTGPLSVEQLVRLKRHGIRPAIFKALAPAP